MDLLANADLPILAAGLGLVLLSLLGLLALLVRRRRARPATAVDADPAQSEADVEVEVEVVEEEAGPQREAEPAGNSLELRTLRAQVHCLEQALAQQPQLPAAPAPVADASSSYSAQVRATLRAVTADVAPGADARYVVDRLTAALDRLDQPGGLTRPALPGARVVAGSVAPLRSAPAAPVLIAVSEPPTIPSTEEPMAPAAPMAAVEMTSTAPEEIAQPEEDEVVVPVPPPAVGEPRRPRRRLRRSAA